MTKMSLLLTVFFFQAEDGIRDADVTGVQTCALPICCGSRSSQKAALHELVKVPLVYASCAIHNWRAFATLGIEQVSCPGGYFSSFSLAPAQSIGGYAYPGTPDEPAVVTFVRTPAAPGLPTERDQHRAGRAELLGTSFETFERHMRDQLNRALAPGGFD